MKIKKVINKRAAIEMSTGKVITFIIVVLVVALVIYGLIRFSGIQTLKNIFPTFSTGEQNAVANPASPATHVIELYFMEHSLFHGFDDRYYFIYDANTKNNLKIAMDINSGNIQGWYSDPNENADFKKGSESDDFTIVAIRSIMTQTTFDAAVEEITKALSSNDKITASWGNIQAGSYTRIGPIAKTTKLSATLKLALIEGIQK